MPVAVYNMLTFESFAWGPLAERRRVNIAGITVHPDEGRRG
jgi:hypothetical protein